MVGGQFARILVVDMYSPSRMFMRFLRKGMGGTHRKARSDSDAGKASPEGDAKILSEAGLAPSGSPVSQIS